ncbi:hypothetical protein F4802DRAFT_424957 [Xylaria palmicola]|nr:hypothetical protein F4802DRAFT_424957 [Xylaria palmicola]
MPSRISLPKLSLLNSCHSPSSSSSAPSSSSSSSKSKMPPPPSSTPASSTSRRASAISMTTPTSPPARLHLRNILPASPEEPPIMPLPPRTPRAWVWQCHRCHSVYRLGCTRRCLDCSHTYCIVSTTSTTSSSTSSSSTTSTSKQQQRGKKRRRQQAGLCGAEFDYVGWEQWGSWKRKVLGHEAAGRSDPGARDRAFLARRHDCWVDCDSPSECCYRRHELAAEALRNGHVLPRPPVVVAAEPTSPDDDISLTEVMARSERARDAAEEEGEGEGGAKSPLGQKSFLLDDDEDKDEGDENGRTKEEEEEERKWWASICGRDEGRKPTMDELDWENAVVDEEEEEEKDKGAEGGSGNLTARNLAEDEDDGEDDSGSGSEYDGSGWSSGSDESDDSSVEVGAGRKNA